MQPIFFCTFFLAKIPNSSLWLAEFAALACSSKTSYIFCAQNSPVCKGKANCCKENSSQQSGRVSTWLKPENCCEHPSFPENLVINNRFWWQQWFHDPWQWCIAQPQGWLPGKIWDTYTSHKMLLVTQTWPNCCRNTHLATRLIEDAEFEAGAGAGRPAGWPFASNWLLGCCINLVTGLIG